MCILLDLVSAGLRDRTSMIEPRAIVRKARSRYPGNRCHGSEEGEPMSVVPVDDYVLDTLMRDLVGHDRHPSAFLVYLHLWRETHGRGGSETQAALLDIADATGLSKRSVQDALGSLAKRKLITVSRESITAVPVYTVLRPWRR
jgi:hypothetical protein